MENMQKGMKRKIGLLVGVIAIIVALIITMVVVKVNKQKENFAKANPELAKAMEYDQVQEGEENVDGTDGHVKFDAFFLRDLDGDGNAESIRGTSREIGKEDTLYMELNVQTAGYLKDAKITMSDGNNFYFQTALPKDNELKDSYVGNNTKVIEFNDLKNGTQKLLTGIVRSGDYSYSSRENAAIGNNINNYSKLNTVTLTGTYVGEDGVETPITKTVNFNIDWYGTARASIYTNNSYNTYYDLDDRLDEENGTITLNFSIITEETEDELILKKNHVEATIPQLNGYDPISVEYTGSNATANYNEETKVLTIDRETQVGEDGTVTSGVSRDNSYSVKVVYPIEAYQSLGEDTVTLRIPVSTYYEGYNNTSSEFTNPYKSNVASATIVANYRKMQGSVARFDVTVGKYVFYPSYRYIISKEKPLKIYNGLSDMGEDDIYQVKWEAYTGTDGTSTGLVMKETENDKSQVTDNFIKTDSNKESMEDVTTNIGIAFSGADSILKDDGWIKVYDEETGDLLVTFTKSDWSKYTASNSYKYELPVKHIRIETSDTNANSYLTVYNIKELDDEYITTNYTREEFDKLQYIKSTLVGYLGGRYINTDTHQANYEAPYSIADIGISNNTISTQITEKNEKITITARNDSSSNQVGWVDGSFVVKLPEEIIDAQINDVQINNSAVSLVSYEIIEQDGAKLIKINTKNNNDTPQTYSITIDVDITPDPRVATMSRDIELYASNEETCDYYYKASDVYDVNDNLNIDEQVNHDTVSLSMVSPNSLLTNQIGSNYDDKGSQVVSPEVADIKPVYGVVDQEGEEKEATIGVQVRNNYGSTISDIQILGKIPFEGNTYVISGGDLGSTFTTKMTEAGIQIPEELQQYATVYYSENENPDRDLTDEQNGWKTAEEVTDWDNVKTYLIDLGAYIMPTGKEYVFNYTVKIPNGLEFNKVSFSHHGVYFSLDTDQGKYRTQTEPNRLGFRIAEKYNLELTKYQTGKDKVIPSATYGVMDLETGEIRTAVTNAQGMLTINGLYAEKAYILAEMKTPDNYELNSDVIRFIGHVDDEGNLTIEKTSGTTKEDMAVVKEEGEDYRVTVKVEDEVKASIKIVKKEQGTDTLIQNVRYKLTGYNLPENGRTVTTNINGEATISGLSINQEYTLTETKAEGYYLADPITFKIVNNDGNYIIQTTSGTIKDQSTTEEDSIPTITLNIEDEKIPTYSLQIIKVKKTTEATVSDDELKAKAETALADTEVTYLSGAKFKLYKNDEEIGEYITDGNGTVTIDNLYQYIEGKDEEATYTLKEVLAPEGYAKVKDIRFKVENKDNTLSLLNMDGIEEKYTVEGNTVKLTIEDSPSFKLIKKDAETGATLAGVKFAIYNVDNGEVPATNSKGEIVGTKETINGREYYTVSTDQNGELTADLTEGLYKAVEVETPEKYDISDSVYYFGIGSSREPKEGMVATWADSIGGSDYDYIESVAETSDGGYIAGGYFESTTIQVGNETLTNHSSNDADCLIIKYNSEGDIEWADSFGGSDNDYILSVASTSDGGYIAGGYFQSSTIQVGNETLTNNNGFTYSYDCLIIKYNSEGKVEWADSFGGSDDDYILSVAPTSDRGILVGGRFGSSTIQVENETLTSNGDSDCLIIKYNSSGEVEWADSFGGSDDDYILSVAPTSDGGIIVTGNIKSDMQVGDQTLTAGNYLIKYNSQGMVLLAKTILDNNNITINSSVLTNDGGILIGGYFTNSSSIQIGDYQLTNNGIDTALIVKYNSEGEVDWAKSFGGSSNNQIDTVISTNDGGILVNGIFSEFKLNNKIVTRGRHLLKLNSMGELEYATTSSYGIYNCISELTNGDVIVGGYFNSTIQVGDKTLIPNGSDGLIIKFEKQEIVNPVVTNASSFGGSNDDEIQSIAATSDGGYIAGGYFRSSTIQLEGIDGQITLRNNGSTSYYDAMIIKYNKDKQVEWAKSFGGSGSDYIESVASTSDGGILVGGYFRSSTIQLEGINGQITLKNNGSTSYYDGLVIKYNSSGEVEWAKSFGGSNDDRIQSIAATSDGGAIAGGYFSSDTIQVGNYQLTNKGDNDGLIIKYNSTGEVEWADSFGGIYNDYINSVASTRDGGILVGGYSENIIQVGDYQLTNNGSSDGLIIKYSSEGEVEWAKSFGGSGSDYIESVASTSDGGILVGGYFYSSTIKVGNETLTNNGFTYSYDCLIIKYNSEGKVEWAKSFGGSGSDYIESVASTSDGGILVGGYFSSSIQVGNEILISKGSDDGLIIKYSSQGEVEWAKSFGGSSNDDIQSVVVTSDGGVIAGGYFNSSTINVDDYTLTNNSGSTSIFETTSDGMILEVANQVGVPEVQELTVENSRKEFNITTDVNEIDGVKGGSISGEDMTSYDKVKYGDSSTKEIVMTPDSGYEIIGITVNGKEWPFEENEDGRYKMPQFTNMTEDKHVVVTYALKDNKIVINKVDSEDNSKKLAGATFKLDQLEERTDPDNDEIIGDIVANGQEYVETDTEKGEVTGVLGDLTNNGTYYFVQNEDGAYVPTNSKTYQLANGGSAGIQSSTANSYIPINLSGKSGEYVVVVNASVSSEGSDSGYATINQSTTAPTYSSSTGRFMYISGTYGSVTTAKDYTSKVLEGGKTYYLHLGYHKDVSIDSGEDQIVINSIKVYEANSSTYNFVDNSSGGYESNNQGQDSTVANSYIPIDLTNYTGKYNLTVNADVSSQSSSDYGYATVTSNTTAPSYSSSTGRFVYISGEQDAQDYTTVLQGGQMYYLHLGYYKNASTSTGDDKFTVNSVKVTLNDSELYHTEVTTNSEGQAITQIPFGKYQITEVTAPEGYELNSEPVVVEFRADGNHEFTIENNKLAKVIVHHYLKDNEGNYTTTKVAEDELVEGKNGEKYTTNPKLDLSEYELEKDGEGNYVLPENATGDFESGKTIEVIYYYETKDIPLTVHHYIEGTTEKVPLKDGGVAEDVIDSGKENEPYITNAIEEDKLSDDYELVETPSNAEGTYSGEEVVVTYYYKKVVRPLVINKFAEDGKTPLAGVKFTIADKDTPTTIIGTYTTDSNGQIATNLESGDYIATETEVPEGYQIPENNTTEFSVTKGQDQVTLDITNTKIKGTVITHHYIMNSDGTTTETKVPNKDGGVVEDVVQTGDVGDIYATKQADNVSENYEYVSTVGETSGTIQNGTIEVIYYYKLKPTNVLVHHYIMNLDGTTTETKVPNKNGGVVEDELIDGQVNSPYTTNPSTEIANNYEVVNENPANANGNMTLEQIVVTYYYKLKTPTVTNTIEKTGTERITAPDQEVNYTITYNANVTDYIGNAEVTIVDTLPYAIDTSKANDLDGGNYDPAKHTITWTENVSDLDSYNVKGTVNITKNIKVFYTGLDMNQEKITNNVRGSIKLLTPETTSEETNDDFESTIYKSIISAEKIVDKTEAQEGEKVTYTVRIKNDGNLAKTVTLADTLPEGLTFDSSTQIKVGSTGTVYTEQNLKNGIQVEVPEYSTVDVVFAGIVNTLPEGTYSKELKNKATLDNEPTNEVTTTVTKPNITAHKESDPVSGTKVTEGDTITYRIRVRNDGTRAGTVLVKDKVPEGTTFVEDSVRIGELQDLTKTAEDLENGISVTLGINEEKVVEFQVRVNKLADGTTIKNTAYINKDTDNPGNPGDEPGENPEDEKVPEEPEHTYVEPKEEQSISKTGTATTDSLDDEITYNINYTAHITDYEGNAKIVLVDQLPYEIDTTKTNILEDLDGGTYDAASKTITWEQPVENIQMTEGREVTINKQIKVVYTGISQDTLSIKNNIKAHIEYETPDRTSEEVTANWPTTTGFIVNIPVSKIWDDSDNKLGQRPTRVVFKLTGSDGSVRTLDVAKPGTANTTTTQDSENPNKWNDIFTDLPKYDANKQEIVYTLTEEQKTDGDLKYYDSVVTDKTVTNTNKYGKVTVHHYVMNPDGSTTETRVPDKEGNEVQDEIIEGKEGDPYETEPADNVNEKYELVQEKLPEKPDGTIEKYDEEKPQEVIYYYRLKPAKVIIHYLEKDGDSDDSNNLVLSDNEQIDGHVDDQYNTDTEHKKDTITKDGKTYTLVSNSGNTQGTMTVADTNVTYYYLQNTKATVRYVEGNPETGEIVKDLETPRTEEGLVGDKFVTNSKEFTGYRLIQSPNPTTIKMTKEEQTLIYWYEPVYTGLIENHIDDKTGKVLYTKEHQVQVGQNYNIPPKNFEGYDRVTAKDPNNASGTMGEELVTVNYYYIKKAVLEVNYIDKETGEPLTDQIVDDTKHEGDPYTTEQKTFEDFDLVEVPSNKDGTLTVETDENGNITNNKTVVTYYYVRKAVVEEHHIDIVTGEELAEPTIYNGHVGDEYTTSAKEFLSYELVTEDKDGNNMLPTNAQGTMTKDKIVVNYYYNQPAKVIVHYVDRTTGRELEENNPETGELQSSQVIIEGYKDDDYTTTPKDFEYYKLVESPKEPNGKMKVEITKDENGKDIVNNTKDVYYYYEPKPFNIGVEKDISAIIVNGERRNATNGKLEKVDIYRKSTENTSVQVEYKIKVMNTGEVEGRAIIEDKLPEGMTLANNDGTWEENGGVLRKVIPEIGAGETKEYTVLLNWKTSGNNMGNKVNEVTLTETDNVPGFKDGNDKDNKDNATVSISVETGEFPVGLLIALVALVGLESVTLRYAVVLTKRQKKNNKK